MKLTQKILWNLVIWLLVYVSELLHPWTKENVINFRVNTFLWSPFLNSKRFAAFRTMMQCMRLLPLSDVTLQMCPFSSCTGLRLVQRTILKSSSKEPCLIWKTHGWKCLCVLFSLKSKVQYTINLNFANLTLYLQWWCWPIDKHFIDYFTIIVNFKNILNINIYLDHL